MHRKEPIFLLHLTSKLYRQPSIEKPNLASLDFEELLKSALKNSMLYFFAQETLSDNAHLSSESFCLLNKVVKLCDTEIDKIRSAIAALDDFLDDYVLFKTCKGFARIPDDLDVYTSDFDKALNRLKPRLKMLDYDEQLKEAVFGGDGIGKIHLHSHITWTKTTFIDNELLKAKPRKTTFHGLKVTVPSNEAELLINMAHVNFEKLGVDITDLIHIYRLASQVNWEIVQKQIAKYHWKHSFERTSRLLDGIHQYLYTQQSPFQNFIGGGNEKICCPELPFSFPRLHIVNSFIERKVTTFILKKAFKSFLKTIKLSLTGKTYEAQGKPPSEWEIYQKSLPN